MLLSMFLFTNKNPTTGGVKGVPSIISFINIHSGIVYKGLMDWDSEEYGEKKMEVEYVLLIAIKE